MNESQSKDTTPNQHHTKAADHYDQASKHHKEAAKHFEAGDHEKAGYHAHLAHGHSTQGNEQACEASKKHVNKQGQK